MEIFAEDAIIGDFQLSDYGYLLASFSDSSEITEDLGMNYDTIEEYIGHNPTPIFLGSKYSSKLKPTLTIIKNSCVHKNIYFSEHECRDILRQLTGYLGYKRMQIFHRSIDEELFYNVRTVFANYQKVNGRIIGVILYMECDSQFAWTKEMNINICAKRNKEFSLYISTDDLNNYVFPTVIISAATDLNSVSIKNLTDNNWTTTIKGISKGESITIDSLHHTITSSKNRLIINNFNVHFPRFVPDKNSFISDQDITIQFKYTLPRKVGFIWN